MDAFKQIQMDLLAQFSRVCSGAGLTWFATLGTLLGAARHGGFIPWDDDIDVAMPRRDYDRLAERSELFQAPYFLQTPRNDPPAAPRFARLMREDTAYITGGAPYGPALGGHMGIHIDILPLDLVPDADSAAVLNGDALRMQARMAASAALDAYGECPTPDWKRDICRAHGGGAGIYDNLAAQYENMCAQYPDGSFAAILPLSNGRGSTVCERHWYEPGGTMPFEDMRVPVPAGWREVLGVYYPEGLDVPPEDVRLSQREGKAFIDTRAPYSAHLGRFTDMLNGIEDKRVVVFGAGDSLRIWLERYSRIVRPVCAVDNAPGTWGTCAYGIPVRPPDELSTLLRENSRLIIVSIWHGAIAKQLKGMGIMDYYVFVDGYGYEQRWSEMDAGGHRPLIPAKGR